MLLAAEYQLTSLLLLFASLMICRLHSAGHAEGKSLNGLVLHA